MEGNDMSKQFIKASWFTPLSMKKALDSLPEVKRTDFVTQGLKPTANNPNGILCTLENFPLAYYDIPTSNKQVFQQKLWQSLLSNEDLCLRMREARSFWGEPFHADSLEIQLPNVSHKVTDFHIVGNNLVLGNVAVVDTPNGNIIYSLLKDGFVGISSRGYGSLLDQDDGTQIVSADDYYHVCWDFVAVPAVKDAVATLSGYAKSSQLVEPILQALRSQPELADVAQIIQNDNTKFSVAMPYLPSFKKPVDTSAITEAEFHIMEPEEFDMVMSGILKRIAKRVVKRGKTNLNRLGDNLAEGGSFKSFDKKGGKAVAMAFDQFILPAIKSRNPEWYEDYVEETNDRGLSNIFAEYLENVLDVLAEVQWGERPLITRNSIKNYVIALSEWTAREFGSDPDRLVSECGKWLMSLAKLIEKHASESDTPVTDFASAEEFKRYMARFDKWKTKNRGGDSTRGRGAGTGPEEDAYKRWKEQRQKQGGTAKPRNPDAQWFDRASSALQISSDAGKDAKDGYCIVERYDGSFWIEDQRNPNFENGPFDTEDDASARLMTIWMAEGDDSCRECLKNGIDLYFDTGVFKRFIKQMEFRWNTNNIPFPKQEGDGKWYLAFGKVIRLGPFATEEEAMKVLKQNYPNIDRNQSGAGRKKGELVKANWTYEYAKGGLAIYKDGKDVAFLQGDEASELYDQLQGAQTEAQIQTILDQYSVLESGKVDKDGKPITSEDTGEDGSNLPALNDEDEGESMSDDETADREEFSQMVLLELAEALAEGEDDFEDDSFGDEPLADEEPIEESAKPVTSADDGEGDDGGFAEEDFADEDVFFPVEEEGAVTVDEEAGTISIATTDSEGESLAVEMSLEDGYLTEQGTGSFDEEGDAPEEGILPEGSVDLFEEVNGDVSAAVEYILDLGTSGIADGTVIDMTDESDDMLDDESME
jgi:hypothetical protein